MNKDIYCTICSHSPTGLSDQKQTIRKTTNLVKLEKKNKKKNKQTIKCECLTGANQKKKVYPSISLPSSSPGPQGYKTFFMLNSAEHEMCPANKSQITNKCVFFVAKHSYKLFSCSTNVSMKCSLLINMKMLTILSIIIFISRENFMLTLVEHEKKFITRGPEWGKFQTLSVCLLSSAQW